MRIICDVCESAAAILFCAADEAALCRACDDKVHMCNKLASRHVRVALADPSDVPRCDICESAPAFFYCEIDGSSLCLQCDMVVHVGGKRTHERYLLLRQRVEFPGDKPSSFEDQPKDPNSKKRGNMQPLELAITENKENHRLPPVAEADGNAAGHSKMDIKMIDLNMKPNRIHGEASKHQQNHEQSLG